VHTEIAILTKCSKLPDRKGLLQVKECTSRYGGMPLKKKNQGILNA